MPSNDEKLNEEMQEIMQNTLNEIYEEADEDPFENNSNNNLLNSENLNNNTNGNIYPENNFIDSDNNLTIASPNDNSINIESPKSSLLNNDDTYRKGDGETKVNDYYLPVSNIDLISKFSPYRMRNVTDPYIQGFPFIFITMPSLDLERFSTEDLPTAFFINENPELINQLNGDNKTCPFIKLLTNQFKGITLKDTSLSTVERFEHIDGWKQILPNSTVASEGADEISITFGENKDLYTTKLFKIWVHYMEFVRKGRLNIADYTLRNKILDFTSSIYYFVLDFDMSRILFYSKYTGCFPTNVPYSKFGQNINDRNIVDDIDITFAYSFKEDLNPEILYEFNSISMNDSTINSVDFAKKPDDFFFTKKTSSYVKIYKDFKTKSTTNSRYANSDTTISSYNYRMEFVL